MGRNDKRRRAAKARQHRRSEQAFVSASDHFVAAVHAERSRDWATLGRAIDILAAEPKARIAAEIIAVIEQQIPDLWRNGWQPADLVRLVDRELGKVEAALVRWVIASQAASYADLGARVAPEWMAQLQRVDATRTWDSNAPYLLQVRGGWREVLFAAVRLSCRFVSLPKLPCLTDPPSEWREGLMAGGGSLPDGVLHKVRALLAKAESTNFDAEADAFTAKAQELMARHRIDRAVLEARGCGRGKEPVGRRFGIDDPYADAKAVLLGNVADANGCRAVWSKTLGFTTVFGFADELDAVDELFTSLLVQATAALRRAGSKHDEYGRSRTRRFRRSFLVAFAIRIGQRLRETVDATVEAASVETGTALVPILAARAGVTTAAAEAAFPETRRFSPAASDGEGWYAGTRFADQADLSVAPKLTRQTA
jgi:Protein of unknown function (DUF2786)